MATIFALSSGAPPAAIAVLRISGAGAFAALAALIGEPLPPPRRAAVRAVRDGDGVLLDRALVLRFPGPGSATGEDLAELHLHGGRAVVRAVEAALTALGLRWAEPGEFTRRALAHGRIDLTEAEALGDLLMAETEGQRRAALRNSEGGLRFHVEQWTGAVLALAAQIEALLDHDEEGDVAALAAPLPMLAQQAATLATGMTTVIAQPTVERLRDGIRVVLAGPPNAGKSSLFNRLAGRDAAIVSPVAGTTRDRIEAPLLREGIAWLLTDTAGLATDSADAIERIGIVRAQEAMAAADLILWLGDDPPPAHPDLPSVIALWPRCDIRSGDSGDRLALSAVTGEGIAALWQRMATLARTLLPPPDRVALNRRQQELLAEAAAALQAAAGEPDPLLFAEQLRTARTALDRITGRADVEAMLDTLFARFCIGK